MIQQHCRLLEDELEAQGKKAGVFDHPDNLGGARECFVKGFLQDNLPPRFKLWTGEIIDHTVKPSDTTRRRQVDVAIVRDDVPAFRIGGDKYLLPCEAVLATVEVKSMLNKDHFFKSLDAIQHWRTLRQLPFAGFAMVHPAIPKRPLNLIFAYQGATLETIIKYMDEYASERGVLGDDLFDMCVVLRRFTMAANRGFPFHKQPMGDYVWLEQKKDNLASLLALLFNTACAFISSPPSLGGYFTGRAMNPDKTGTIKMGETGFIAGQRMSQFVSPASVAPTAATGEPITSSFTVSAPSDAPTVSAADLERIKNEATTISISTKSNNITDEPH